MSYEWHSKTVGKKIFRMIGHMTMFTVANLEIGGREVGLKFFISGGKNPWVMLQNHKINNFIDKRQSCSFQERCINV